MEENETKKEWAFKETMFDLNASNKIKDIINLCINGNYEEAIKKLSDKKELLETFVIRYASGQSNLFFNMSTPAFLHITLKLFLKINCLECIEHIIKNLPNEIISITIALVMLYYEKEFSDKVISILKSLLNSKNKLIGIEIASKIPIDMFKEIKPDIMKIAKVEVDAVQYKALKCLTDFINEDDVKKLYMSFIDDFDPEVRRISVMALLFAKKDNNIATAAKNALRYEDNEKIQLLLKKLIRVHSNE